MVHSTFRSMPRCTLAIWAVGGLALALAACTGNTANNPAAKATNPATSQNSTAVPPNAESATSADASKTGPAAVAGPNQESQAIVSLKAVDQATGQTVALGFQSIHFDYDKYAIRPEEMPAIKHNADLLKRAPNLHVVIEGHCDERGTTEYNLALGQRRAVAVYQALATEAVAKNHMTTISYGKERPADSGHTEEAWAKNRRSEFRSS